MYAAASDSTDNEVNEVNEVNDANERDALPNIVSTRHDAADIIHI